MRTNTHGPDLSEHQDAIIEGIITKRVTIQIMISQTTWQVEPVQHPEVVTLSCVTGSQLQVVLINSPCVLRHTYKEGGRQITVKVPDNGRQICLMPEGADKALSL